MASSSVEVRVLRQGGGGVGGGQQNSLLAPPSIQAGTCILVGCMDVKKTIKIHDYWSVPLPFDLDSSFQE